VLLRTTKAVDHKEADMEETIGYEALFSPEEWAELEESGWILSEAEVERPERSHRVSVAYPPGEYEGNEKRYELECDVCDYLGAGDSMEEAQAIARLHEAFIATLVEKWSVDR
jgi:hypothetical protein